MKITNAIKAVSKAGFTVNQNGHRYSASKVGTPYLVEFIKNGGDSENAICIGVRHNTDHSDSMTDYCATIYTRNIKQAIELALS
jgi:hypothetical protein